MTNWRRWKFCLSSEIIVIYVLLHLSRSTEIGRRIKRDDASYASGFGGPVAMASGPEDDDNGNGNSGSSKKHHRTEAVTQALMTQPVGKGIPALPPTEIQKPVQCQFQQKPKQVLFIISNNARQRRRRDDASFLSGVGGPVAQKEGPDSKETNNQKPISSPPGIPSSLLPNTFNFLNTTFCQTQEICFQKCQAIPQCNYFMRSFFNFVSYMYEVNPEKLKEGNYTESLTYDSFIQNCIGGPPVKSSGPVAKSSGPDSEVDEDPKKKFIKKLNEFNQKQSGVGKTVAPYVTTNETKCVHLVTDEQAKKEFEQYLTTFNEKYGDDTPVPGPYGVVLPPAPKTYESAEEREKRYQLFKDNLQIVQQLNCGRKDDEPAAFLEVSEFSDQSYEEFISFSGGSSAAVGQEYLKPQVADKGAKLIAKCPKFNWADQGVVPAPRKQGKCGACYAFSTSDLIASQYHIDRKLKGQTFTLSPQYLVDCMKGPAALGCNGGRPIEVLRNFTTCTDPVGCNIPKEECYPYKGKKDKCKFEACQETPKIPVRWASINDVSGPMEKEKIAALLHWGPAVVIIDASQAWQFYSGKGILRSTQCGTMQNHAVLLTGYDFTGPVPYYIIKNSWGAKWGNKGFIKLEADKNSCGIAKSLTVCCTHNCDYFKDTSNLIEKPNSEGCL